MKSGCMRRRLHGQRRYLRRRHYHRARGHIIIKLNGTFSAKWKVRSTERSAPERRSHDKHAGGGSPEQWSRHVSVSESGKKFCCHASLLLNCGQNASPWPWVLLKFINDAGRASGGFNFGIRLWSPIFFCSVYGHFLPIGYLGVGFNSIISRPISRIEKNDPLLV